MIIIHEELELGPGNSPNDGGLSGENAGGGGAWVENRYFTEGVAGLKFGEFDLGGLALAADGEFACDEDKHATEFSAFIDEIVGRFDRDELAISREGRSSFFGEVGGDP